MRRRTAKDHMSYFAPAISLTLTGFIVAYQFVDPAPPRHFTIATGRATGACHETARKYSRILAEDGVTLTVRETSGSLENLKLLTEYNSGNDCVYGVFCESVGLLANIGTHLKIPCAWPATSIRFVKKLMVFSYNKTTGTSVLIFYRLAVN